MADTNPTTTNEATVKLLFLSNLGVMPTPEELAMFVGVDSALAQSSIKDYANLKKEEATKAEEAKAAEAEAPAQYSEAVFPQGKTHLIKFSQDPTSDDVSNASTVWLYDSDGHEIDGQQFSGTLIPFQSEEAFNNFFAGKMTLQEAADQGKIKTLGMDALTTPGSIFNGARMVKQKDGILGDGRMIDREAIRWRYGQERNPTEEDRAAGLLYNKFQELVLDDPEFNEDMYKFAFEERDNFAKYLNAMTYGGFDVYDIYKDVVASYRKANGDAELADYKGISGSHNASDWKAFHSYKKYIASNDIVPLSEYIGTNWDATILKTPLMQMPRKAYEIAIGNKDVDINDPDTKAKIAQIETMLSDVAIQMAEADNARDISVAQYNWEKLKTDIERSLNITLGNNALEAWDQIQGMKSQSSDAGIINSGIFSKALDQLMKQRRRSDGEIRESSLIQKDAQLRTHLLNNGTTKEIEDFIAERGLAEAEKWGLIPDEETKKYFSLENMKKMYPSTPDNELQEIIDIVLGKTSGGIQVYKSTLERNHNAKMRGLQIARDKEKTDIYLDERARTEDRLMKPFTEGGTFDPDMDYAEQAADAGVTAGEPADDLYGRWIKDPKEWEAIVARERAAGRDPEKAIARVTDPNGGPTRLYIRNLDLERKRIGQYTKDFGQPPAGANTAESNAWWQKFRDAAYTPGPGAANIQDSSSYTNPITNKTTYPDATGKYPNAVEAASKISNNIIPKVTTNMNAGERSFVSENDTKLISFKNKNTNKDWSGYEKISGPDQSQYYTDIQNPGGSALYGKRK